MVGISRYQDPQTHLYFCGFPQGRCYLIGPSTFLYWLPPSILKEHPILMKTWEMNVSTIDNRIWHQTRRRTAAKNAAAKNKNYDYKNRMQTRIFFIVYFMYQWVYTGMILKELQLHKQDAVKLCRRSHRRNLKSTRNRFFLAPVF